MNLSEFADKELDTGPGAFLPHAGPASLQLLQLIGNETRTHPLIGTLFWDVFTTFRGYDQILELAGLRPEGSQGRQEIVVRHGAQGGALARYDLLVLDSDFTGTSPAAFDVTDWIPDVWETSALRPLPDWHFPFPLSPEVLPQIAAEAAQAQRFNVLIANPPETEPTTIAPAPAWEVAPRPGEGNPASAGVVALNIDEHQGVTSADHAFAAGARYVTVAGIPGTITSRHQLSDSCFIEIEQLPGPVGQDVIGPLSGLSPTEGEDVRFRGVASVDQTTTVTGWDKGIPFEIHDWNRLRVFTNPVTERGDSGAALLDQSNQVIGFAFDRTGAGAKIEYSSWIWAEFVYRAHGLH